jgi:proteic killer suppression protein
VIRTFRHKGLRRLFEEDERRRLPTEDIEKLRRILARLDAASSPDDMNAPGFKLHPLKGDLKSFWAVTVRANWRVIFRFEGGDAFEIDYLDYH